MYEDYYGLTARPFQLTPDPDYYFDSRTHRKALSYLGYGLAQGEGFIVITGEIGSGKSTLVAHLMRTIDTTRLNVAQIVTSQLGASDLLQMIARQFGIAPEGLDKAALIAVLEEHFHEHARNGRRSLLIVDEAQMLDRNALEELRMLSNLQLGNQALLQIFLLGQPEFRDILHGDAVLEQLRQRVIATHHLEGMSEDEVQPYIEHRLRRAGWNGNPRFSNDAINEIYNYSDGIPRLLNAFMSRVLLMGAMEEAEEISGLLVRAVHADIVSDVPVAQPVMPKSAPSVAKVAFANDQENANDDAVEQNNVQDEGIRSEAITLVMERLAELEEKMDSKNMHVQDLKATVDRMGALEARVAEQERAIRRIVTKLIGWVESEETQKRYAA